MDTQASHNKRITADEIGTHASLDLTIWLFFQLAGDHVLLPLLVATFLLSRSIVRHHTVVSVCCTWIISGVASSLLFYRGLSVGQEPSKGLCIAQSAMMSGVYPMTSVATLALTIYMWSSFNFVKIPARNRPKPRTVTFALLGAPYCIFFVFAIIGALLGMQRPERVNRAQRFFYCSIKCDIFTDAVTSFSAVVCIIAAILALHIAVALIFNRRLLRRSKRKARINLQFCVRVGIFTAYMLTAAIARFAAIWRPQSVFPDMFTATVGMATFLIFGTQTDVVRSWVFCRRAEDTSRSGPNTCPPLKVPYPSFDLDLLKRTDSEVSEQARLEALHNYYSARVRGLGVGIEIISRPEEAFAGDGDSPRHSEMRAAR
ncbi:hypothetical protein B0H21DRAFT_322894 [Amylocystis lapponica]|nr:hypothetical protein B0H21DRAFT_322894 [Amylocystis lapponica]